MPNLLEATHDYWQKLNELEAAYQRGEVSPKDVEAKVTELMADLGRERKASLNWLLREFRRVWVEQRDIVLGIGLMGLLMYIAALNH